MSAIIMSDVLKTAARALRLLSLLQVRREWSGAELGRRLDVDVRTVRRDVDRLRQLGYAIDASAGPGGGYRLGAGSTTPPLLLDDDEAVAVAVALGVAAGNAADPDDVSLRVLAKLDQLLPRRVRRRLSAVPEVTVSLVSPRSAVSLEVLAALAAACRDHLQLRFAYRDSRGAATVRLVEPMRLVHTGRRWYLAAWDVERADWRTFRVDRLERQPRVTQGARFVPREPPEDFATLVSRSIAASPYRFQVRLRVQAPIAEVREQVPPWAAVIEPDGSGHSVVTIGGDSAETIAAMMIHTGLELTLLEPAALAQPIREIAARLLRGTDGGTAPPASPLAAR